MVQGRSLLSRCLSEGTSSLAQPCPMRSLGTNLGAMCGNPVGKKIRTAIRGINGGSEMGWGIQQLGNCPPSSEAGREILGIVGGGHPEDFSYLACSPPTRACNPVIHDKDFLNRRKGREQAMDLVRSH